MIAIVLSGLVFAGIPYTEEELQELSELTIAGVVSSSTCLSYNIDNSDVETYIYEATITIDDVLTNTLDFDVSGGEFTLRSINTTYPEGSDQPACSSNDDAHPIGESGTYYLYESEDFLYIYMGGFIPAADSNPQEKPSCPDVEEEQNAPEITDEMNEMDKGCSNVVSSSWLFWLALVGIRRR